MNCIGGKSSECGVEKATAQVGVFAQLRASEHSATLKTTFHRNFYAFYAGTTVAQ
jgi:hypothetical protein